MSKKRPHIVSERKRETDTGLRACERIAVDWQATVQCRDWEMAERIAAGNISRGGMFLRTERSFGVGARVEIALQLPEGGDMRIMGSVRHVRGENGNAGGAGIGVEIDGTHHKELRALVEIARLRQGKPTQGPSFLDTTPSYAGNRRVVQFQRGNLASIVGIDFGTTFCGLAIGNDDSVCMVPDPFGRTRTPTLISFVENAAPTAVPTMGWDALRHLSRDPSRCVSAPRRLLGVHTAGDTANGVDANTPVNCVSGADGRAVVTIDEQRYDAAQLCASLLRHVCETAQQQLGQPVAQAVLSHPVSFTEAQLTDLKLAAELAGISVATLVPDPLATARAAGCGTKQAETVAVIDFGGGAFHATLLEISPTEYRIIGHRDNDAIGGDAFDKMLADAVADLWRQQTGVAIDHREGRWYDLLVRSERAKRRLSTDEKTSILMPTSSTITGSDARQCIERPGFERICAPLLRQALDTCRTLFQETKMGPQDVSRIILSGGITQVPFVRQAFERLFERELEQLSNPEESVALGLGLFAAQMAGHPAKMPKSKKA